MNELFNKILEVIKAMRKVRFLKNLPIRIATFICLLFFMYIIYLFALNGRYKSMEGAGYGIYIDSWTGKIHSSLVEFEKQNK